MWKKGQHNETKPGLARLVEVRSRLVEDILKYLEIVADKACVLPTFYPSHFDEDSKGKTRFDNLRQLVQVKEVHRQTSNSSAWDRKQQSQNIVYDGKMWDEKIGSNYHRAIILGHAGFGKTWLLGYEARHLAQEALAGLRDGMLSLDELVLPIFVRLTDVNRQDGHLEDELLRFCEDYSPAFETWVRQKLETKQCAVLLDAWDEIPEEIPPPGETIQYKSGKRQRLGQRLEAFARRYPNPGLLLTSRFGNTHGLQIPEAQELELVGFGTHQIPSFVRAWFEEEEAQKFLAALGQNQALLTLARSPLMLAMICRIHQDESIELIHQRVDLYERSLRGLLWTWNALRTDSQPCMIDSPYTLSKLEIGAFNLLLVQKGSFTDVEFTEAMGFSLSNKDSVSEAKELFEMLKNVSLIIPAGVSGVDPYWLFLHHSFQEYLAAKSLVSKLHQDHRLLEEIFSNYMQDKNWHEVFSFSAELLEFDDQYFFLYFIKSVQHIAKEDEEILSILNWAEIRVRNLEKPSFNNQLCLRSYFILLYSAALFQDTTQIAFQLVGIQNIQLEAAVYRTFVMARDIAVITQSLKPLDCEVAIFVCLFRLLKITQKKGKFRPEEWRMLQDIMRATMKFSEQMEQAKLHNYLAAIRKKYTMNSTTDRYRMRDSLQRLIFRYCELDSFPKLESSAIQARFVEYLKATKLCLDCLEIARNSDRISERDYHNWANSLLLPVQLPDD